MARNTLTQRTFGPVSSASSVLHVAGMKEGDYAGLCLLQKNYGQVGVKVEQNVKKIFMTGMKDGKPFEYENIPLTSNKIYFKASCNFKDRADKGNFYYSEDGVTWKKIGVEINLPYTLPHFIGYRFGIFYYSTKESGGFTDFDWFRITDKL